MKAILRERSKLQQFLRFCVVGIICTAIDAGVYYSLYHWTGYQIAMISGFFLSLGINYLLNTYWSFRQTPSVHTVIGVFAAHCLNIFVVRMALMWLFIHLMGLDEGVAFVPTLIISVITNFLIVRAVYSYYEDSSLHTIH